MCILKIYNKSKSYKSIVKKLNIKPYLVLDKGEKQFDFEKNTINEFVVSFNISNKGWDDLQKQIKDAVRKLNRYKKDFNKVIKYNNRSEAFLDFPIYDRHGKKVCGQVEYFPPDLMKLCGELNINLVITIYK